MALFTARDRDRLREELLSAARADGRITGAALFGSASVDREDRWSDVDLTFGVGDTAELPAVLADWTDRMYRRHGAAHHCDIVAGASTYRVFLLESTLQVDLAFTPESEFGARGDTFRLLFGSSAKARTAPPAPDAEHLIGMAWLHALHARSCIRRGELWRAEYMVSGMRDLLLTLACLRCGLPTSQARGADRLPPEARAALEGALVRRLEPAELSRALGSAVQALDSAIRTEHPEIAMRLGPVLSQLVTSARADWTDV